MLQYIGGEILRFIDDENATLAIGVALQQKSIEGVDVVLDSQRRSACTRGLNVKLFTHRLQQFGDGQFGIEDIGHMAAGGDLLQETAANSGFAGSNVAGQQHKSTARHPPAAAHAIQEVRQGFPVALAHEQIAWVRCDGKRVLCKTEVLRIHKPQA